jgi:hypothetical protein
MTRPDVTAATYAGQLAMSLVVAVGLLVLLVAAWPTETGGYAPLPETPPATLTTLVPPSSAPTVQVAP